MAASSFNSSLLFSYSLAALASAEVINCLVCTMMQSPMKRPSSMAKVEGFWVSSTKTDCCRLNGPLAWSLIARKHLTGNLYQDCRKGSLFWFIHLFWEREKVDECLPLDLIIELWLIAIAKGRDQILLSCYLGCVSLISRLTSSDNLTLKD